jgi:DNA invertase Pin-like site-specific DNA recombinase
LGFLDIFGFSGADDAVANTAKVSGPATARSASAACAEVWMSPGLHPRPGPRDPARRAEGGGLRGDPRREGKRRDGRTELQLLLDFLRAGDTLVVTRIDRLARSLKDLEDIVHELKARGVALKATEQPVDTGTAAGKAFLDMLGVFAEFETNLRRERQLEGISAAKARGVYKGRKPTIDAGEILRLRREEKLGPAAIARRLSIGRASVYRLLGKHDAATQAKGSGSADQA